MLMKTGVVLPNKRDNVCGDTSTEQSLPLVPLHLENYKQLLARKKAPLMITAGGEKGKKPANIADESTMNALSF